MVGGSRKILIVVLLLVILPVSCKLILTNRSKLEYGQVVDVIDGDTIKVEINGSLEKVRYIGVDTPETKHPTKSVQYFGREAFQFNKKLVDGKKVRFVKDVSQRDKYGRLLRYVYVDDIFVNAELVKQGYAYASTYPPDIKYASFFYLLQRRAREKKRGLWGK
ncbi:MAG: hypothetical protein C4562_01050 [Actinobacteria bacterium]|nr:MAG: hypothetical protein C4562_01050 [Actinomycetota bacterium]